MVGADGIGEILWWGALVSRTSPFVIQLSESERIELEARSRHHSLPHRVVVRAKLVLMAAGGMDNHAIGASLGVDRKSVSRWRKRFFEERLGGLEERPRSGRPRRFSP
jgi:hypothetical protein